MRTTRSPQGVEDSNVLDMTPPFRRPDNCPVKVCSAITMCEKELERHRRTEAALREAVLREIALLRQKDDLILQNQTLASESEHRLLNGLQLVKSILAMQSRNAGHPETAAQLAQAAKRISTIARVHQHLHALDARAMVEFKPYLEDLCNDLSDLLPNDTPDRRLCVEAVALTIPRATATPLAFIVTEVVTNAIKYATGNITVSLQVARNGEAVLAVSADGPALPASFDPDQSKGLGMRIISVLASQIHAQMTFANTEDGRGTRFSLRFHPQV